MHTISGVNNDEISQADFLRFSPYHECDSDNEAVVPSFLLGDRDLVPTKHFAPSGDCAVVIEATPGLVGAGEHDEEEADREVDLIARKHEKC